MPKPCPQFIAVVEPWDAVNAWFYEQEDSWFGIDMPEAASPGDFVLMVTQGRCGAVILGGFLYPKTLDRPILSLTSRSRSMCRCPLRW